MDVLREWIAAAEAVRTTCQNKPAFDQLVARQKQRLADLEKLGSSPPERKVLIPTAELSRDVSNFTIGFGKIDVKNNAEIASSAGSGTLVTIGSIQGILTAAHVLDALPNEGEIAIILFSQSPAQFKRSVINMSHTSKLAIRSDNEQSRWGPDLGFLRLAPNDAASLSAVASFYNLTKHADEVLGSGANLLAPHFVDAVTGIVHERTKVLEPARGRQATCFEGIFVGGQSGVPEHVEDYDLVDFTVTNKPDFPLPASFEGTSGGALWRFFYDLKDEQPVILARRLLGVPFWQSTANGNRILTCHGPQSVYSKLVAAVMKEQQQSAGEII